LGSPRRTRPNHPTTCGKIERLHQTLKRWLGAQPRQPATLRGLQGALDRFVADYNAERPHSSLRPKRPPIEAYRDRPKATPGNRDEDRLDRVRHDRVDRAGKVTLRLDGRLYSIGLGRRLTGTRVTMLVQDLEVRVVDASTGELLRELTIDLEARYQGQGLSPGRRPES